MYQEGRLGIAPNSTLAFEFIAPQGTGVPRILREPAREVPFRNAPGLWRFACDLIGNMPALRSLRVLRRHWKLAAIAFFSLSIALCLGVVSLSLSNTFLLLPPAAPEPDRLAMIYSRAESNAPDQFSWPDYLFYRAHNHVFTDIAAAPNSISLVAEQKDDGRTVKLAARPVSDNYFAVMGLRPWLGRFFTPGENGSGGSLAVMTFQCWRRLGADPKIIGKVIAGNTIVGIAPKEFTGSFYGLNGDLLTTLNRETVEGGRDRRQVFLLARMRPEIQRPQAQAEMAALASQLAASDPKNNKNRTAVVTRATMLPPDGAQGAQLALGVLLAVVLLVLLIACANVANLLLAIAVGRRQEASIKMALGAPRGRLIREFLRESALLCGVSGLAGFGMAAAVAHYFSDFTYSVPIYGAFSFGMDLRLDATVAAFTALLVLIAIAATGIAPALYASSPHVSQVLGGETAVGGTRKTFRRSALAVAQVAICTVVLIGMGLCQQSLYNLRHVDVGFSARNLVAAQVYGRSMGYTGARAKAFYEDLRKRVSALPGVEAATLAADLPLFGGSSEEIRNPRDGKTISVSHTVVDAHYFSAIGAPLLAGRGFLAGDGAGAPPVTVVNQRLAGMFWPGESPVGRQVSVGDPARVVMVVGVVANSKYDDLDEAPQPFLFFPLGQNDVDAVNVIARTGGDPALWSAAMGRAMRDMNVPALWAPVTFDNWMNLTIFQQRAVAACVAGLSALALLLAAVGLFGAISYSVSERKKELGIRVALGARPPQLMGMILRQTLRIASVGLAIGIALGVGVTALVRSELYQIAPVEWVVLLGVSVGVLAVAAAVAWASARPWIRVSPMEAVRHA